MNELVKLENGKYGLVKDAVDTITTIENEIKKLKEMQDNYKEQLLKVMEENDILKIEIPEQTTPRSTRSKIDISTSSENASLASLKV